MDSNPPTTLQRLWAGTDAADQAPKQALNLTRIVAAALELADTAGLDAVSMNRVAQRLGNAPMALYRHVASKDELLLFMHDAAWQLPADLEPPVDDWRAGLVAWCQAQRAVLRRRPWLERIRITERVGTPSQLAWLDRGLRCLAGIPLSEHEKTQVLILLNGQVFWDARLAADLSAATQAAGTDIGQVTEAMRGLFQAITDTDRFPHLSRSVAAGVFAPTGSWQVDDLTAKSDSEFRFGLELVLDGVAHLIASRTDPMPDGDSSLPVTSSTPDKSGDV